MKLSILTTVTLLLTTAVGTGDRGTYERMMLYNAYISEEIYKPGGFTIAPGCIGTREDKRCTFLELIKYVWAPSGNQATMPGAGPEPDAKASKLDKIAYYNANLGAYGKNPDGTFQSQYGLRKEEDGRGFATFWVDNPAPLEKRMLLNKWDKWMNTGKMASGATSFPHVFRIAADALISARIHLDLLGKTLSVEETAIFKMAENVGTTIENLRVEDGELHRTGGKPGKKKQPVGKGDLATILKSTPEFKVALTPQEFENFAIETKSSGIQSKPDRAPWQVFDPVATAAKWSHRVPNVETIIMNAVDYYNQKPKVLTHAPEIEGIRDVNRRIQNWDVNSIGLCSLG